MVRPFPESLHFTVHPLILHTGPQLLSSSAGSSLLPKRKRKRIRRPGPLETETCSLDGAKPEKRAKVSELVSTSPSEGKPLIHYFLCLPLNMI